MIQMIIYYLIRFIQGLLISFNIYELGKPKKSFLIISVLFVVPNLLADILLRTIFGLHHGSDVTSWLQTLCFFVVAAFLFEGKVIEKVKLFAVIACVSLLSEAVAVPLAIKVFNTDLSVLEGENLFTNAALGFGVDSFFIFALFSLQIFNRKKAEYRKNMIFWIIMECYTVIHFVLSAVYYRGNAENLNNRDIFINIVFQVMIVTLMIILYYAMKNIMYKSEMQVVQQRIEQSMNQTNEYYSLAKDKFDEIARIRHDFKNQIQAVEYLVSNGEISEAEKSMSEISESIDNIRTVQYCSVPIINAVLSVKLNECIAEGIKTDIVLQDCEKTDFDNYDFCCIISNLFDNAINACKKAEGERFIEIKSRIIEKFFILKVRNSCNSSAETLEKTEPDGEHGYGLRILKSIAEKHNGSFKLNVNEDIAESFFAVPFKK